MKRLVKVFLHSGFITALATVSAFAQTTNTFDEYGHGIIQSNGGSQPLSFTVGPDPTGGLVGAPVLIYSLGYLGVRGDVLIFTGDPNTNPLDDVIRFDGSGNLIFYADNLDGYVDLADTLGPPNPTLTNQVNIIIQNNLAYYTPVAGEPGYNASGPNYVFQIDVVPEPAPAILLLGSLGVFGLARLRHGSRLRN
jgi:hypothetical protein